MSLRRMELLLLRRLLRVEVRKLGLVRLLRHHRAHGGLGRWCFDKHIRSAECCLLRGPVLFGHTLCAIAILVRFALVVLVRRRHRRNRAGLGRQGLGPEPVVVERFVGGEAALWVEDQQLVE